MTVGAILFVSFVILLCIGLPVSISMGASSLLALIAGNHPLEMLPLQVVGGTKSFILLAIPLFILAGNIMNRGGITKRIFDFATALVGWIPGGLAQVNVMASIIFAGISGTAVADQAGLGLIEMQSITEAGYDEKFAAGITLASSIIGPIIPPSVPFILHSYLSGVSTAKLFAAGIIPGLFIAFLLMFYCYRVAVTGKVQCPAPERFSFARLVKSFKNSYLAVLAPVIILVGMLSGVVTPTETGIVAVTYCTIVGFVYKDLRLKDLPQIIRDSVLSTALIMFLVGTGSIMGWIVSVERLPALVSAGLLSITTNKYLLLFLINVIVLALGCVMEGIPIKMFLLPILIPILNQVGVDQVHFGVVMTIGTLLGMLTPPVGLGLYVMTTISNLTFEETIQAVLPLYGALLLALFILTYVPAITLWLPNLLFG